MIARKIYYLNFVESLARKYVTTSGTEGLIVCHQTFVTVSVVGRMLFVVVVSNLISRASNLYS